MPVSIRESNVRFDFPEGWAVIKFDDSAFYRKHLQQCAESAAVDFIAVSPDGRLCWFIEVKDFTSHAPDREKAPLWSIVAHKVRDTLAGMLAASWNASDEEREFAQGVVSSERLRVCFHCERPTHASRLMRSLPDEADLRQKLRAALRAVDSRIIVMGSTSTQPPVPWTTTWEPEPRTS